VRVNHAPINKPSDPLNNFPLGGCRESEAGTITVKKLTYPSDLEGSVSLGHKLGLKQSTDECSYKTVTVNNNRKPQIGSSNTNQLEQPRHLPTLSSHWKAPEGFRSVKSAKIWFIHDQADTNTTKSGLSLLSYIRRPRYPGDPESYDTLGGTRDSDEESITACLVRELEEEVRIMPEEWQSRVNAATTSYPAGHNTHTSVSVRRKENHHTTVWFICTPNKMVPTMSSQFYKEEGVDESLKWRPIIDIIENLNRSVFHQSLALILHRVSCRWNADLLHIERPHGRTVNRCLPQQKRGLIEVCTGLGMMADSCVREGFASVIATCDNNSLCCELQKYKHPNATHHLADVTQLGEEVWSKYRWDPQRPMETAYLLVSGPPCTPYSTAGRQGDLEDPRAGVMQHLVHLARIMQPRLVVIENVEGFLDQESWKLLQGSFNAIDYYLVHKEIMVHSELGGATSRRRVFIWFQINIEGQMNPFPRLERTSPFEVPQMVIRDILDPIDYPMVPTPLIEH
jgi:hypothetical protein